MTARGIASCSATQLVLFMLLACWGHGVRADAVVVDAHVAGSAHFAGIRPGDVLIGWQQDLPAGIAEGVFESPLDVYAVESIHGWRAAVTLRIARNGNPLVMTVPPGDWRAQLRPDLPAAELRRWSTLTDQFEAGDAAVAAQTGAAWRDELVAQGRFSDAAWLSGLLAREYLKLKRFDDAFQLARTPLGAATGRIPLADRVTLLERHGLLAVPDRPGSDYRRALRAASELEQGTGESLRLAKLYLHLAAATGRYGDTQGAHELLIEAERLALALGPKSLVAAKVQHNLGTVHLIASRNDVAAWHLENAIQFYRTLEGPAIDTLAGALSNLGIVAMRQGRYALATAYLEQSLDVTRRVQAGTAVEAKARNNLATVLMKQADYRGARHHLVEALVINRQTDPSGISVVRNLSNLASVDAALGNAAAALEKRRQIVEIYRAMSSDGPELAFSLQALGDLYLVEGQAQRALDALDAANAQMSRVAPRSEISAQVAVRYATALIRSGNSEDAAAVLDTAVPDLERLAPESLQHGLALAARGELAQTTGEFAAARADFDTALRIVMRDSASSDVAAELYYRRGQLAEAEQQPGVAEEMYAAALEQLERQRGQVPAGDQHERFLSDRYRYVFEAQTTLLVGAGRIDDALRVTEMYRARSLLARLGREAHGPLAPETYQKLLRVQRALDEAYVELSTAPGAADRVAAELVIDQLEIEQAALRDSAETDSAASGTTAGNRFRLEDFQRSLHDATLALTYFKTGEDLMIFAVTKAGAPRVVKSAMPANQIATEAQRFRLLISRGRHDSEVSTALVESGARLYAALVAPFQEDVDAAERLLLVADGALQSLPFAALVTRVGDRPRYLVEEKTTLAVQSLAIHTQLARREPANAGKRFVGFGAVSAGRDTGDRRGDSAVDLPATQRELDRVAALFDTDAAQVFVGAAATEANVTSHAGSARYLHFATHAEVDTAQPLHSFLQLTPAEGGDGRLELGDVVATLRLTADLVTLSACETALGQAVTSEGLMSLARAFQLAGARNVVASLWKVPDQATALLMTSFYAGMGSGLGPPEALRAAQLRLLSSPVPDSTGSAGALRKLRDRLLRRPLVDARHPYHWASFQLLGPGTR